MANASAWPPSGRVPRAVPGEYTSDMGDAIQAMNQRITELTSFENIDPESVRGLCSALWEDWGNPALNFDFQHSLLLVIQAIADDQRRKPDEVISDAIRSSLLEFCRTGGLSEVESSSYPEVLPDALAPVAGALVRVARAGDGEVQELLEELASRCSSSQTTIWTPEVVAQVSEMHGVSVEQLTESIRAEDLEFVELLSLVMADSVTPERLGTMAESFTGSRRTALEAVLMRTADDEIEAVSSLLQEVKAHGNGGARAREDDDDCPERDIRLSEPAFKTARAQINHLRRLARRGVRDADEITRLSADIAAGSGDRCVDRQLVAVLLITYRRILERPRVSVAVVRAVDAELTRIATAGLVTAKLKNLWARAVAALRRRASAGLRDEVARLLATEKDSGTRRAMEWAARHIGVAVSRATELPR